MSTAKTKAIQPDWVSKTLAGVFLGFTLAIGCSDLFSWLASEMPLSSRGQLAMWMMAPVWMGVISGVYFFSSGKRAWACLAGANLLVFGLPLACRTL